RDHDGETFELPMLAFFCVAMRREAFASVGALDERFGLGLFEDGDYNRRARAAGWTIRCARDAFVHHWQNASFRRLRRNGYFALYEENRRKFEEKYRGEETPRRSPGRAARGPGSEEDAPRGEETPRRSPGRAPRGPGSEEDAPRGEERPRPR